MVFSHRSRIVRMAVEASQFTNDNHSANEIKRIPLIMEKQGFGARLADPSINF